MWASDPGTGSIGFVSKFCAIWWYLCVRNTDLDPDRTKFDFGTPLPKKVLKYARILLGLLIQEGGLINPGRKEVINPRFGPGKGGLLIQWWGYFMLQAFGSRNSD